MPSVKARRHRENARARLAATVGTTVVAGVIVGTLVLAPASRSQIHASLFGWIVLSLVASLLTISFGPDQPVLSMDLPVLLACAFVEGPIAAGLVALIGTTDLMEVRRAISPTRAVWNHAQVSLSVMAAGWVFQGLGGQVGTWPAALFYAAVGLVADALVNYLSVSLILSLSTKRKFGPVLRSMKIGEPITFYAAYAGFGLTGLLMAEVYVSIGYLGLVAFLAPLFLAREAFRQRLRAFTVERDLAARRQAFRSGGERIAEEREDERARIAEALHDDVLQSLYSVTVRANVVRECYRSGRLLDLEADVPGLIRAAERAVDELRKVIQGLRRSRIGHAGLVDTLTLLVSHLRDESGIVFVQDLDTTLKATPDSELLIYQVAREALVNAQKHSEASTIWVSLHGARGFIELTVLDNGVGFDPDARRDARHFGIDLMRERVDLAGGELQIHSQPGCGVQIDARFPGSACA